MLRYSALYYLRVERNQRSADGAKSLYVLSARLLLQGLVGPNHVVLDPFVGTGSLLIAAAHYG